MKIIDILSEYRIAPLGQEMSSVAIFNLFDTDDIEILRTHVSFNDSDFVIKLLKYDSLNHLFALVNRLQPEDIAGYLRVKNVTKNIWQVEDVCIYSKYRNLGLGTNLYVKIIQTGYTLINGESLSIDAEKLWLNLSKFVNLQVYNKKKNEIEALSNKPTLDNSFDQEYYFIASSKMPKLEGLNENFSDSGINNFLYEQWLLARGKQISTYRSTFYGEIGDF